MSDPSRQIIQRLAMVLMMASFILLTGGIRDSAAHQDPCHRLHSCPSDRGSYVCGDKGRCEQCPDNPYCLAGHPRAAGSPSPTRPPPASTSNRSFTPEGVTVCFTPGGHCTEQIVKVVGEAQRSILVQAYSFTSHRSPKRCLTHISGACRCR
jgi:hypothetical protein